MAATTEALRGSLASFSEDLRAHGWAWLQGHKRVTSLSDSEAFVDQVLRLIGKPLHVARQTGLLRPLQAVDAYPASLSAVYGLGDFPLHSDTAHWPMPARYLALYCVRAGDEETQTVLLDVNSAAAVPGVSSLLRTGMFFVRSGRSSFYSTVSAVDRAYVRFDPGCMDPINPAALDAMDWFSNARRGSIAHTLTLREGELLVLDNWRVLHARGAVRDAGREIVRGLAV